MKTRTAVVVLLIVALALAAGCNKKKSASDKGKDGRVQDTRCPEGMIFVEEGVFSMGCSSDAACYDDEKPSRAVKLNPYCLDAAEVTRDAFNKTMKIDPAAFKNCGADCPVEQVTWNMASDYCRKLEKRLPTEAEWEKAARAGATGRYFWPDGKSAEYAWLQDNSAASTHPVAKLKPNSLGFSDMLGNVAEWTHDCYDPTWLMRMPELNPVNETDACEYRVVRGGAWKDPVANVSLSDRSGFSADITVNFIGFRCAAKPKL